MKLNALLRLISASLICAIALLTTPGMAQAQDATPADLLAAIPQLSTVGNVQLIGYRRVQLTDDIVEHKILLKVGPDAHDIIGVYRVVKEQWRLPIRTRTAVMMLPGDASTFATNFLAGAGAPADHSIAVYLAEHNIDVWGMDFRWAFVPDLTNDFSFMQNWDMGLHLGDVTTAIKTARLVRALTGSGNDKLFLLGMSRGAQFVYGYANAETQLPAVQRTIKGIIPIDMVYKIAPDRADLKQAALTRYQAYSYLYSTGMYASTSGAQSKLLALLAVIAPNQPSPAIPGLTNFQAALITVSATYVTLVPPLAPYTPTFHYLAGTFDETTSLPTGLTFTDYNYAIGKVLAEPSYQSLGEIIDGEAINGDAVSTPYDQHLSEIDVPVLYIGAAGGYGEAGIYTTTLLGSTDKQSLVVSLYPAGYDAFDYGHADLLWAGNAEALVWQPMLNWIMAH